MGRLFYRLMKLQPLPVIPPFPNFAQLYILVDCVHVQILLKISLEFGLLYGCSDFEYRAFFAERTTGDILL